MYLMLTRVTRISSLCIFLLLAGLIQLAATGGYAAEAVQSTESSLQDQQGSAPAGTDTVAQLTARANQYWSYRVKGDLEKAYAFEDPETIEDTSLTDYVKSFGGGIKWLAAEVDSATIAGDKAQVLVRMRYRWQFAKDQPQDGMVSIASEYWRNVDGVWYHRFADARKFRGGAAAPAAEGEAQPPAEPGKDANQ